MRHRHPPIAILRRFCLLLAVVGVGAQVRPHLRTAPAPRREVVAILLNGEAFREGGQASRHTGANGTERTQRIATESQIENLVRPMKNAGYDVFCFIATSGPTNDTQSQIMQWYQECMPPVESAQPVFSNEKFHGRGMEDAIERYGNYTDAGFAPANYFILMRPDLILKRELFSLWNTTKEQVAFPFKEWCRFNAGRDPGCYDGFPPEECWRVPDNIMAMPSRAFEILVMQHSIWRSHDAFRDIVNTVHRTGGIEDLAQMHFWLSEGHDSDTMKDWNPIFALAGRPENDMDEQCGNGSTIHNPTIDSSVMHERIDHTVRGRDIWKISISANGNKEEKNETLTEKEVAFARFKVPKRVVQTQAKEEGNDTSARGVSVQSATAVDKTRAGTFSQRSRKSGK